MATGLCKLLLSFVLKTQMQLLDNEKFNNNTYFNMQ